MVAISSTLRVFRLIKPTRIGRFTNLDLCQRLHGFAELGRNAWIGILTTATRLKRDSGLVVIIAAVTVVTCIFGGAYVIVWAARAAFHICARNCGLGFVAAFSFTNVQLFCILCPLNSHYELNVFLFEWGTEQQRVLVWRQFSFGLLPFENEEEFFGDWQLGFGVEFRRTR